MRFNVLTLFPAMFAPLQESMIGRAVEKGLLEFNIVDIRDYSRDKHTKADDYPFGGGQGLVMMPQPAFDALAACRADRTRNIYLSPRGRILDRALAEELAGEEEITLFCGHYEGLDQRVIDAWQMEEVSIGDYILTGGEMAALVLIDVTARLIPGVLASESSALDESVYSGLLEYPQYTQPRSFAGLDVPEVLLSGNHKKIALWRYEQSLLLTKERRPDLFAAYLDRHPALTKDEALVLEKVRG
ncbi:MAG: tRNA (guanosine(37)-N1)-methyltransferase TrmD [Firmicutes bacterium]|nr:tRNA (guanosine(37)-N1)-methyltransferase TrmD [Bacillota bacterium]